MASCVAWSVGDGVEAEVSMDSGFGVVAAIIRNIPGILYVVCLNAFSMNLARELGSLDEWKRHRF